MKREKIIFLIHELTMGGAQRVVTNLANEFAEREYEVEILLFTKRGELYDSVNSKIKIHYLNVKKVSYGVHKMVKLLLREKPDIVFSGITHVSLLLAPFIPLLRLFMKKTRFVMREVSIPSKRLQHIKRAREKTFLYKRFISNYDNIIAQSNFMKKDIAETYGIEEEAIDVVNNPLNLKSIHNGCHSEERVPLLDSKINLLATGRLGPEKGFDKLLELMTLLGEEYHLHILGKGREQESLEKMIEALQIEDKVTLHGEKKNPYVYMKKADIALLSSHYEGYPNVVLEANACGTFAIAFACPGVNGEIIEEGVNGYLVEDKNVIEMAKAIERYRHQKRNHQAIIKSTDRYAVHNIVEKYQKLWREER